MSEGSDGWCVDGFSKKKTQKKTCTWWFFHQRLSPGLYSFSTAALPPQNIQKSTHLFPFQRMQIKRTRCDRKTKGGRRGVAAERALPWEGFGSGEKGSAWEEGQREDWTELLWKSSWCLIWMCCDVPHCKTSPRHNISLGLHMSALLCRSVDLFLFICLSSCLSLSCVWKVSRTKSEISACGQSSTIFISIDQ